MLGGAFFIISTVKCIGVAKDNRLIHARLLPAQLLQPSVTTGRVHRERVTRVDEFFFQPFVDKVEFVHEFRERISVLLCISSLETHFRRIPLPTYGQI